MGFFSQACSWGGDITGGQAGPSLSWLGAPAPAPGHWHHQEPGLAALAWPLPPGLVPRGCAAAQRWALLHADIPGGLSQSQLPPGRRARRRSSQGPLLRNKTSPLRGGGCLQKPGDPQAPPDPSAGSDGAPASSPWFNKHSVGLLKTRHQSCVGSARVFPQTHVHQVGDAHPAISSSVVAFSSCPQSLQASGSFPMSQLCA